MLVENNRVVGDASGEAPVDASRGVRINGVENYLTRRSGTPAPADARASGRGGFRSSAHPAGPNEPSYLKLNICGSVCFQATSHYQNLYLYPYPHPGPDPYPNPCLHPRPHPYLFMDVNQP